MHWLYCSYGEVRIDAENFPDDVFRAYVSENCDTEGDDVLSEEEIADVVYIDVHGKAGLVHYNGTYDEPFPVYGT